ncbi:MAG: ATP-binding cassette domain-containing protein, partial [Candidatus Cybelea sp.]
MSDQGLHIKNLRSTIAGTEILKGIDLLVEPGRVAALMGPNGSGKSTLAFSLTGHPSYEVSGSVELDGEDILALSPDKRARAGLF